MINPLWLELPMSQTNFLGPKDVRAIEVRLYIHLHGKLGPQVILYPKALEPFIPYHTHPKI